MRHHGRDPGDRRQQVLDRVLTAAGDAAQMLGMKLRGRQTRSTVEEVTSLAVWAQLTGMAISGLSGEVETKALRVFKKYLI